MARSASARLMVICGLLLIVVAGWSVSFYPSQSLSHDPSWYLVATQKFIDGAILYFDIIEINPPLAFYVTIPAVHMANWIGWAPTKVYALYCIGLALVSAIWSLRLVLIARMSALPAVVFFTATLAALFILPIREFGQREHLLLIFAMPYLVFFALCDRLKSVSKVEQGLLGSFAFLGFALKPYFFAIPAFAFLALAIKDRNLSKLWMPAHLMIGFLIVCYVVSIYVFHPLYIEEIVPVARLVYGSYGVDPVSVLLQAELFAFLILTMMAVAIVRDLSMWTVAMWGAAFGAVVCYLVQFKGWNYHIVPVAGLSFICCWSAFTDWRNTEKPALTGVLLAIIVSGLTIGQQLSNGPYKSPIADEFAKFVERPNTPLLVMSTNVSAAFPFVNQTSAQWVSGYPTKWILPGAIQRLDSLDCERAPQECHQLKTVLEKERAIIVKELHEGRPELVYVDDRERKSYFGNRKFDYIDFLSASAEFRKEWNCYARIGKAGSYQVWSRRCRQRRSDPAIS